MSFARTCHVEELEAEVKRWRSLYEKLAIDYEKLQYEHADAYHNWREAERELEAMKQQSARGGVSK